MTLVEKIEENRVRIQAKLPAQYRDNVLENYNEIAYQALELLQTANRLERAFKQEVGEERYTEIIFEMISKRD